MSPAEFHEYKLTQEKHDRILHNQIVSLRSELDELREYTRNEIWNLRQGVRK